MKGIQAHIQEIQDWLQIWQTWMTQHASIKWFYGFKLFVNLNRFMHTFYIKYLIVVSNIIRIHTLTYYRSPKCVFASIHEIFHRLPSPMSSHKHIGKLNIGLRSHTLATTIWIMLVVDDVNPIHSWILRIRNFVGNGLWADVCLCSPVQSHSKCELF